MEKRISKKLLAGILAMSAGFILASCDPVSAVPKNYNNPIISSTDGAIDLDGNTLGTLYDSITSEKNEKIVEKILSMIAENKFGSYAEFLEASKDDTKKAAFISAHEEYFGTESTDERFAAFKEDINERISEYFYNEITSGTYNDDLGRFSEKKLYNAHKYELYDLGTVAETEFKTFFVDKELTKKNAFGKLNTAAYEVAESGKRGYIQEKVYPDILRNKLVEDYIYKNNPSSLGRAYGRNLSYVKLAYEGESKFAEDLMEKFAVSHIQVTDENVKHIDFSIVENAYKGFKTSASQNPLIAPFTTADAAKTLLESAKTKGTVTINYGVDKADDYKISDLVLIPEGEYYLDTKVGQIIEDYQKAIEGEKQGRFPTEENKAALDSFTGEGKSKQYGLLQKLTALMKEDYTVDGWYVKNGGVTELPSAIRDRLFNIRVANSFKDILLEDGSTHAYGDYEYEFDDNGAKTENKLTRLPYLRNLNGKKVVLPDNALSYDKDNYNYIYHDRDAKAFYVCEVLEAPSTAKLNASSDAYTAIEKENISRQIAKILGTKDSYIKDAYTEYLNKYEFTFYDSSLYEYFKSEYPDLDQFAE